MTTPEHRTKLMIKHVLATTTDAYYAMPVGSGYGNAGVPDFVVCYKGWFIGIEAKAGKGKPTALQLSHLERIKNAGGLAMVIYENDEERLRAALQALSNLEHIRNAGA